MINHRAESWCEWSRDFLNASTPPHDASRTILTNPDQNRQDARREKFLNINWASYRWVETRPCVTSSSRELGNVHKLEIHFNHITEHLKLCECAAHYTPVDHSKSNVKWPIIWRTLRVISKLSTIIRVSNDGIYGDLLHRDRETFGRQTDQETQQCVKTQAWLIYMRSPRVRERERDFHSWIERD